MQLVGATPFRSPRLFLQGDTIGWGNPILFALVAFCLLIQVDGATPFRSPQSPLQGDTPRWGD
jgi:hypothetical protein